MAKYCISLKRQIKYIEDLIARHKKINKKHFPKVFIEKLDNGSQGYRILGYEQLGEQEILVTVLDSSDMSREFFANNIYGEIGYFLGIPEEYLLRINRYI